MKDKDYCTKHGLFHGHKYPSCTPKLLPKSTNINQIGMKEIGAGSLLFNKGEKMKDKEIVLSEADEEFLECVNDLSEAEKNCIISYVKDKCDAHLAEGIKQGRELEKSHRQQYVDMRKDELISEGRLQLAEERIKDIDKTIKHYKKRIKEKKWNNNICDWVIVELGEVKQKLQKEVKQNGNK